MVCFMVSRKTHAVHVKTKILIQTHLAPKQCLLIISVFFYFLSQCSGSKLPEHPLHITSLDRPKSAPYPRLKNSKRTSKFQFTVLENRKSQNNEPSGAPGPASASPWRAKEKKKLEKKSHNAEKLKGGPFGGFSTSVLS